MLLSRALEDAGFRHAFPQRGATDEELALGLGLEAPRIVQAKQVHGARAVLAAEAREAGCEADALVARAADGAIAVGIRTADCVPVLVADVATGDVAAIHAGWRGVVRGVIPAALAQLCGGPGARGAELVAAIGPCIGPCCFEVGADVAAEIAAAARGAAVIVVAEHGPKAHVDLRAAVRAQLVFAGVGAARIEDVTGCTKHEPERFHSFRRDGKSSGRMLAAIATRLSR